MISFKNGKLSLNLGVIAIVLGVLLAVATNVAYFAGGLDSAHTVSDLHVAEDGTRWADVTHDPGWAAFWLNSTTSRYECTYRGHWKSDNPLDAFDIARWLDKQIWVTEVEILDAEDHQGDRSFSTTCTAVITYNTGDKVTGEYVSAEYVGYGNNGDKWRSAKANQRCSDEESQAISFEFQRRTLEVVDVQDRSDIGWTYYEAILTLKNGTQLVRKYISKNEGGWYRYPLMRPFNTRTSEYSHLMQAYDRKCAQSIFGSTQTASTESE